MTTLPVREVMNRDVIVLYPSSTIMEAASDLAIYNVPGAPVVTKKGELIGLLSEEDIVAYIKSKDGKIIINPSLSVLNQCFTDSFHNEEVCKLYQDIGETKVEDIMTEDVVTVSPEDDAEVALETMVRFNITRLPVVSNGILVGMLEKEDLVYNLHRAKVHGIISR